MIAGLPWNSWLLVLIAAVPALLLVARFRSVHRRGGSRSRPDDPAKRN